jgi:D-xylonolactonase
VFAGSFLDDGPGKLYRFDPDGSVTVAEEGIGCSNGIGYSPDHSTMYYTDSTKRTIYAYDYDQATGNITNRRDLIKLADTEGVPDGMTVDADGYIWTAVWFGGCIIRFDPDGREEQRIHLPAYQTSSVMFGGKDLTDIYVTTADFPVEPGGDLDPVDYDWDAYSNGYRGGGLFVIKDPGFQGKEEYKSDFSWPDR